MSHGKIADKSAIQVDILIGRGGVELRISRKGNACAAFKVYAVFGGLSFYRCGNGQETKSPGGKCGKSAMRCFYAKFLS